MCRTSSRSYPKHPAAPTEEKKVKAKKGDAKPRKKKRLRWVEVEDEVVEEDIIDAEEAEVDESEK